MYNDRMIIDRNGEAMEIKQRYLCAKRRLFDKVYGTLNESQRQAVFTTQGPLLVLAGAGSGKTTVLVRRIAFIIRYGNAYFCDDMPEGLTEQAVNRLERASLMDACDIEDILPEFSSSPCPPWQVLAITFTNKAANEIKSRIRNAFEDETVSNDIWAGTFHSICMRILRTWCESAGYAKGFTVYDADDSKKTVCSVLRELNIDEKMLPHKTVLSYISRAKERLMTPEEFARECNTDFRTRQIAKVYRVYQKRLSEANALDFDDIIMQTVRLLERNEEARQFYQRKFRYVAVDEYQDTNYAQFRLTELLGGGYRNVMVVGDDDQSIYKFRGADITNILNFDSTYKDAKVIRLEDNYRSTSHILQAANAVIRNNASRKGKTLRSVRGKGEKLTLRQCDTQNEEARYIVDTVLRTVASGKRTYRDFAVLYRTNAQSNVIERAFAKSGVPYRLLGGVRFNDRKEIRDIVAYLQLINNHADNERLKRIINVPGRKIGQTTVDAVETIAREQGISMFAVLERVEAFPALSRSAKNLSAFAELIRYLSSLLEKELSLEALVKQVLDRTGYRQMLIDAGEEEKERLENVEEFISNVIEYSKREELPTLTGFLEDNALVSDVDKYDETADAVVMMTIHSAKGLEFPVVFLPGMEDGIFPGMQNILGSPDELEEERRLAYVAITRAKDMLYLIHTKNRMLYGRTSYNPLSRFVHEIPEELIEKEYAYAPSMQRPQAKVYFHAEDDEPSAKTPRHTERVTVGKTVFQKQTVNTALSEGDRVSHPTFGEGEILSARPMGSDVLYEVTFDRVGTKKLMGSFARLRKLS